MGIYLNPDSRAFKQCVNSEIYVDKTGIIGYTNRWINTNQKFICVSRPRRFGKSITADMLVAYYSKGCNSGELFENYEIGKEQSFEKHLNKHNVIYLDIQGLIGMSNELVNYLQVEVNIELARRYMDIDMSDSLVENLNKIYDITGESFVFIVDEWDCILRKGESSKQREYLNFLNTLWKGRAYVDLVYMTGILPVKKYGTHSILNMFMEISMIQPEPLERYIGFTEDEVSILYNGDIQEAKAWYDGYEICGSHIYNPNSVVISVIRGSFDSYWVNTEVYEALQMYIEMDFDGLKDCILRMLGGERCKVNTRYFSNDMMTFKSKDDVLTLLIHLGYLGYNKENREVYIPNEEVYSEFVDVVRLTKWGEVLGVIQESDMLLKYTLDMDESAVAKIIDKIHRDNTSIINYNGEESLSCVISLAYYSAKDYYHILRECHGGKGFADLIFRPHVNCIDKAAMIIELKYGKSVDGAIKQIKDKLYVEALKGYTGDVILVGINYDKSTKEHQCKIEKIKI